MEKNRAKRPSLEETLQHEWFADYKEILDKEDTIIIDWNDLNQAYHQFKLYFNNKPIDSIINSNKSPLCLRMHQYLMLAFYFSVFSRG